MDPFSPGTNVIVGRNGSGKSNFFAAIRFVLGDAYTQLSREERQALLHEGSGSAVMSAYVEIIFDNSDNRFQTGNKEVSLRRTITLKKDEYAVDKKVSNRSEVMSMLDTAGFSLKNSYYIVPQGRVTALTNMKESDRLKLLKEVAGTESYEARRGESLKIMTDTNHKRGKIDELLEYIKSRMEELEEEKEELRGFQEKDRERRCLEYAYYHQQQVAFTEALDEIEQTRQGGADTTGENQRSFLEGEKLVAQMQSKLQQLQQSLEMLNMDRREYEEDRRETSKLKAKAELKVKSLADTQSAREQAKLQHDADLRAVREEIATKEKQLGQLAPEYEKRKAKEAKVKQALDAAEAGRQRLLNKQARGSRFNNKAERDRWIDEQVADLNRSFATQKANFIDANEEVRELQLLIQTLEAEIADLQKSLEGYGGNRNALSEQLSQAQEKLQRLDDERRALHREDDKLQTVIANARHECDRAKSGLNHAMDRSTARGIETIERLKREQNIRGAYGTLADLMEVSEAYRVPVEQIAGNSLFHYVVDNEKTGTRLAEALYKQHGGRVTFMPLEQLRPRPVNFPRASDAVPLVSKITYDALYDRAFQQVFGKTIICPNLTIAAQYARSHNVDGITPEGDTTNKRGAMTGGFVDPGRSRLAAVRSLKKWRDEYARLVEQADQIKRLTDIKDQEYASARGEERKLEQKLRQLDDGFEPLRANRNHKKEQIERERARVEAAVQRRERIDATMKQYAEEAEALEAEKKTDFKKALTPSEEQALQDFSRQVQDLQKQWSDASTRRREVEGRKQILDSDLRQNLRLKEDQLTSQVFETISSTAGGGSYADAVKELKKVQKRSSDIEKRLLKAEADIEEQQSSIADLQTEIADKEQQQQEVARAIERHQKKMEKSLQRKALLTQQLADCAKNIRDLGVLPDEAFDKYERMDAAKVRRGFLSPIHDHGPDDNARAANTFFSPHRYPSASRRSTRR